MISKAQRFRELHDGPEPLVLPNAWDAAIAQAAYAVAERAARELLTTGGYGELERQVDYADLNALARRP